MTMKELLKDVIKSKFSIGVLSTAYLICFVYLFVLTVKQWNGDGEIKFFDLVSKERASFEKLSGPIRIKDSKGSWGWPNSNNLLRLLSFLFLTFFIIAQWILMKMNRSGILCKINFLLIGMTIIICFSAFSVDVHQINQSTAFCQQHPKLCGGDQKCECSTDGFGKVPALDFLSVICATLILILFIARTDSEKKKEEKKRAKTKKKKKLAATAKPPKYEREDSEIMNGANDCYSDMSKSGHFNVDAGGKGGNFYDSEKSFDDEVKVIVNDDDFHEYEQNGSAYD